jgi:trehalose 6-phosphate synthase/phosphatase
VAVTSRGEVNEYRSFKRSVDELVGRINGRFGTSSHTPIRYMNRGLDSRGVAALYLAADVMLVTPLRDGLNLVAKEFVATRTDGDGALVLSEFAGVAAELGDAIMFNPYDLDGCATAIERALAMPEDERRRRMASLREAVTQHDVHGWVRTFLGELQAPAPAAAHEPGDYAAAAQALAKARANGPLCVLLDYDGSLVSFAARPELAVPDPALLSLLDKLAHAADVDVHLVSGRPRTFLERHFGALPLGLHAEHGFAWRLRGETAWASASPQAPEWRDRVQALLERIARHVPGSHVEVKEQSVGWHFRQVDPAYAATVVKELRLHLLELLSNLAATVVEGNRVLEIRPQSVHKGQAVARALAAWARPVQALVVGDDRTDEDMFVAAPADAITVRVGPGATAARHRVADPNAVRALLRTLLG